MKSNFIFGFSLWMIAWRFAFPMDPAQAWEKVVYGSCQSSCNRNTYKGWVLIQMRETGEVVEYPVANLELCMFSQDGVIFEQSAPLSEHCFSTFAYDVIGEFTLSEKGLLSFRQLTPIEYLKRKKR